MVYTTTITVWGGTPGALSQNVPQQSLAQRYARDPVSPDSPAQRSGGYRAGKRASTASLVEGSPNPALTERERRDLVIKTIHRIDTSYSDFCKAVISKETELKNAQIQGSGFLGVLAEVAIGLALPGAGPLVASAVGSAATVVAKKLTANVATATVAAAKKASSEIAKTCLSKTAGALKEELLKKPGSPLELLAHLQRSLRVHYDNLVEQMLETKADHRGAGEAPYVMSDAKLNALHEHFAPEHMNVETYSKRIDVLVAQFNEYVAPIGTTSSSGSNLNPTATRETLEPAYLNNALCLARFRTDTPIGGIQTRSFIDWARDPKTKKVRQIPRHMRELALAQFKKKFPNREVPSFCE